MKESKQNADNCEFLIPARRKVPTPTKDGRKVRIGDEEYALLCEMYNESTMSFKELVNACVRFAADHVVYVKGDMEDEQKSGADSWGPVQHQSKR